MFETDASNFEFAYDSGFEAPLLYCEYTGHPGFFKFDLNPKQKPSCRTGHIFFQSF